jgi:hypothetical protein
MNTDPAALRETLAKCRDMIATELDALLNCCCVLDYPDGNDGQPVPRRDTLDEGAKPEVEAMEAVLADMRAIASFTIGERVQLARDVEIFDLGVWRAGTTGTVTWAAPPTGKLDDGLLATIELDGDHPALAEWDGCLQVYLNADDDCPWWKWMPASAAQPHASYDLEPHSWVWCTVETPSVFKDHRLPDDPSRKAWTDEHKAAWAELEALAEQHGTSIRTSSYRRG